MFFFPLVTNLFFIIVRCCCFLEISVHSQVINSCHGSKDLIVMFQLRTLITGKVKRTSNNIVPFFYLLLISSDLDRQFGILFACLCFVFFFSIRWDRHSCSFLIQNRIDNQCLPHLSFRETVCCVSECNHCDTLCGVLCPLACCEDI